MGDFIFPPAFEQQMRNQLHDRWPAFAAAHQQTPPVSVRLNPAKTANNTGLLPAPAAPIPWASTGFYLAERPSFTLHPPLHAGAYYVQEASSMFLEQALRQTVDLAAPLRVLDLCAAPGGKSTHLLSLLSRDSLLVSNEVIRARAGILAENIQKWGYGNAVVTSNDPHDFERLPGFFDVVVVDAPCSGEGMFRKDPDAMREWSPDSVQLCSKRQRRILADVWPALKEGGILVYSTCTYNAAENEDNLAWLAHEQGATLLPLQADPAWGVADGYNNVPGYRFYPDRIEGEGFFLCAARKTSPQQELRLKAKTSFTEAPVKMQAQLHAWLYDADDNFLFIRNDLIQAFPRAHTGALEALAKNLYIIEAGTTLATAKHDKLVPEHAAALHIGLRRDHFPLFELSLDDALAYLRKDQLNLAGEKGFAMVTYGGLSLGWINVLPNRVNNLYPAAWRIRSK